MSLSNGRGAKCACPERLVLSEIEGSRRVHTISRIVDTLEKGKIEGVAERLVVSEVEPSGGGQFRSKNVRAELYNFIIPSGRIELPLRASEARVLSVELRGQKRTVFLEYIAFGPYFQT